MFTPEEKELLANYVTSTEANVYAVTGMPGMVGAAYARYSRAKGGFREVLLKEFIKEGNIDPKHADELIQRILIAYGDDSVGELEGAHVSFERISMIATKEIEDRRIGGSPIEQSTRYVLYDQKDDSGNWLYYRGPEIMNSNFAKQYVETMDEIFSIYASLIAPLKTTLEQRKPLHEAEYDINGDGIKERLQDLTEESQIKAFKQTYTFELRAKACDILRALLPLATITNVGTFGNGRFFQNVLSYLWTSELPESHVIGDMANDALQKVIPQYVRRAKRSDYTSSIQSNMHSLANRLFNNSGVQEKRTTPLFELLDRGEHIVTKLIQNGAPPPHAFEEARDIATLASMLYPYCLVSMNIIRKVIAGMSLDERKEIVTTYVADRVTRRDRPGRALEEGYPYTFDLITNFGTYKDLERHRMNTQQRQLFTAKLGFEMPEELVAMGVGEQVEKCIEKSEALYDVMIKESPILAQYAVLHGHFVRWTIGMNDREAMHMLEIRSTPQGHPQYRYAAQMMHKLILERSKWRGELMTFVDHNDYYWSRADSEAKQRVKEAKLEEKLKK